MLVVIACSAELGVGLSALAEQPLPQVERLRTSPVLQHLKPNPLPAPPKDGPQRTLAQMYVPEGFRVELVVAEPDLHQPIAFAFDERGRIWVAEAHSYPQKRPAGQGLDKIVVFDDRDGDGRFETRKLFAEGLNLVSGLEVGYGGVWVGAAPELLFIPDGNRDDTPDGPPQVLLDGFGYQDTHECLNSFLWGPDGWLYGNQGVFNTAQIGKPGAPDDERVELRAGVWRYHPVRHEFEVFAEGGSNQWGLDYDERGQIFMTHCRSYWGRGGTTHVIQGGVYWNQANAHYPTFIIPEPPADLPEFRNYLLASARYDHGAGGAGKPGSDAIYGGHSHVGTMMYLGDNWPEEFRGHLFTHNLHGHQINHQLNQRLGSGFDTVHAGRDQFFCSDPKYVAVDLQYGPDGAVYVIDWYDQQHCHNPNTEHWDRGNGRIYRMQWQAAYQPRQVDLARLDDAQLVELHSHKNEWYVRTARRLLTEHAQTRSIESKAKHELLETVRKHTNSFRRLSALWTLHGIGAFTEDLARQTLGDPDEYVRAWAIQLALDRGPFRDPQSRAGVSPARRARQREGEDTSAVGFAAGGSRDTTPTVSSERNEFHAPGAVPAWLEKELVRLGKSDPSPVVRLYLASAMQRVPEKTAWQLAEVLAQHGEDRDDRNLPYLIWQGVASLITRGASPRSGGADRTLVDGRSMAVADARLGEEPRGRGSARAKALAFPNLDRAFSIAERTRIPQLADWIHWYAATFEGDVLNRVVGRLEKAEGEMLRRRLAGLWLAMEARANVPMPATWRELAPKLYRSSDIGVRRNAERLAAAFGDDSIFPRLRQALTDAGADAKARQHAFAALSRAPDRGSQALFISLLDDKMFCSPTISLLARFDSPEIASALIQRFESFSITNRAAALNTLTSRASFALALLDALASGRIKRDDLTSFHVRQLIGLKNSEVEKRVAATWGRINQTPGEKQAQIARLEKIFNEAPLWAYDGSAGRGHFQKLCSQCHRLGDDGARVGPELTGAGKNGIRYYLENIIDPNAVIGTDFQMTTVETKEGEVLSGLVVSETPSALTLRTTADQIVVAKTDLTRRATSELSLMPEGLLESLSGREQLELLKFLTAN